MTTLRTIRGYCLGKDDRGYLIVDTHVTFVGIEEGGPLLVGVEDDEPWDVIPCLFRGYDDIGMALFEEHAVCECGAPGTVRQMVANEWFEGCKPCADKLSEELCRD